MTMLFFDGFDVGDGALKWFAHTDFSDVPDISATTPYGYGKSLRINAQELDMRRAITPSSTAVVGCHFRWPGASVSNSTASIALWSDGGTRQHITVAVGDDGTLILYRGDTGGAVLAFGPANQIHADTWYFIEVKGHIDDSSGTCVVRVNTVEAINFTGDTRNGGVSASVDSVSVGAQFNEAFFDNVYCCNTLDDGIGPANNDFLGVTRVQTLKPNGTGTDTDLVPTGSVNNWDNVNDVPWSSADYNTSTSIGDRDTYQLEDMAGGTATVLALQTTVIVSASDTAAKIKPVLRSGGTVYYDPEYTLASTDPVEPTQAVREVDPATGVAWTISGVNALEAGIEVTG